jgi:hypothetical protein
MYGETFLIKVGKRPQHKACIALEKMKIKIIKIIKIINIIIIFTREKRSKILLLKNLNNYFT